MIKPNPIKVSALSFHLLLFNCAILDAGSIDRNNQETGYDFYLSGNAHYRSGEYDKAISAYRKSVELDPDYCYAHINLGAALAESEQFEEAIQEFTLCMDRKWGSGADRFVFYFNRALANTEIQDARAASKTGLSSRNSIPLAPKSFRTPGTIS